VPFFLLQPLGHAASDELLDICRVAAEHAREAGEILAALGAEAFKDKTRIGRHSSFVAIGKFLYK
jgi:hypothetical protein